MQFTTSSKIKLCKKLITISDCNVFFSLQNLFQTEKGLKVEKDRYDCFCFCSSITKTNKISYLIIIAGTKAKGKF